MEPQDTGKLPPEVISRRAKKLMEYLAILRDRGKDSPEARTFKEQNASDPELIALLDNCDNIITPFLSMNSL